MAALEVVLVAVLILLNGYLAMCELAIVSSRRSQLERRAGGGDSGARAALILANGPAQLLASLQIGITSDGRDSGEAERGKRHGDQSQEGHLHLRRPDLLANIFRRPADHEAVRCSRSVVISRNAR